MEAYSSPSRLTNGSSMQSHSQRAAKLTGGSGPCVVITFWSGMELDS